MIVILGNFISVRIMAFNSRSRGSRNGSPGFLDERVLLMDDDDNQDETLPLRMIYFLIQ